MKKSKIGVYIFLIAALWMLNSCGSSKPFQRYLLVPLPQPETTAFEQSDYSKIVIKTYAIEFPEYLNTPKIVSFKKSNELYLDEYNRWASPLKNNFEKVLLEDVAAMIPTERVSLYGAGIGQKNVFGISVNVLEFGLQADSAIVLNARWGTTSSGDKFTLDKKSFFSEDGKGTDYNEQAKIMSELTAKLAKEIALEIRKKYDAGKK